MKAEPNDEQIAKLKESMLSMEDCVRVVYSIRTPRQLIGHDSVLTRTLGDNYRNYNDYESTYFDERRNEKANTEFAESMEALRNYDKYSASQGSSVGPVVDLLLEVGDVLFQKYVVKIFHNRHESYATVMAKLDDAILFLEKELSDRGLSIEIAKRLTEVKYSCRIWLESNGFNGKNKELELKLCAEEYLRKIYPA